MNKTMNDNDFTKGNETKINPKDISKIEINRELPPHEKKAEYLRQTGSKTVHKVGDVTVKCNFGDMPIEKMFSDLIYQC
jgi:hypothetical protein